MSTNATSIEWTDLSWNPITGCKEISPGCANCYAARLAATRLDKHPRYQGLAVVSEHGHPHWTGKVMLHEDKLREPYAKKKGKKIFVCDMSDLFYDGVPPEFIHKVFAVMHRCQQHTFQVLTKRIDRLADYLRYHDDSYREEWRNATEKLNLRWNPDVPSPLPNVWFGTSIENQSLCEERLRSLLNLNAVKEWPLAKVLFVSFEPLLERIVLPAFLQPGQLHWGILGGESGPGARDCDVTWIRSLCNQLRQMGAAVFVKQLGSRAYTEYRDTQVLRRSYLSLDGRKLNDMTEWPYDLQIRHFPEVQDG